MTTAITGLWSQAALAQAATDGTQLAQASSSAATSGAEAATPAAAPDNGGVADILVTARRRVENLQSTPVSATVLSGDNLVQQNVRNFADLRGRASNLEIVPLLSGGTSFTIRGVGQTSNQVNADSKAGFYVDEMYVSRQEGNDLYFYDIGSVQVLKGPQGTLFGKNTTAGAVLLTTNRPTDRFEGYGQVRVGSYKRIDTEGAINVPITDNVYARASFRTQNADGFIDHVLDDDKSGNIDNKSLRLQLRADFSPLKIDILGEYNGNRTDGGASIVTGCYTTAPASDTAGFPNSYIPNYNALHKVDYCSKYPVLGKRDLVYGGATLSIPTSSVLTDRAVGGDYNSGNNRFVGRSPYNNTDVYTANGRFEYDLTDKISARYISTYRRSTAGFYTPTVDAPDDIYAENDYTKTQQVTQEVTLGGTAIDDRLNFLAGGFFFYQKTHFLQDTGPDWIDPLGYIYDGKLTYKSYAAFAQASFKFTDALEFTAGLRYTYDQKQASSYVFYANNSNSFIGTLPGATAPTTLSCGAPYSFTRIFLGGVANCAGAAFTAHGKDHWDGLDPKFQLGYRWSPTFYTYVTVSHGYNSGGFNQQIGATPPNGIYTSTYNPEKLWSYEGGFKADLLDRKLQLNVSGFYQDYSDIQSTVLVFIGNISTRQFSTAGAAREAGFEAEFVVRPTPDLTIRGNGSYLDQKYTKIEPGALFGLNTPLNSAPKYQYSAAVSYDFHVLQEGVLTPTVDVRGIGKKPACFTSGTPTVPQIAACNLPAYALLGFRIDFLSSPTSPWRIGVYGTNVLDKLYKLSRTGYGGGMGNDRYTPGRPQEFGAEISFKF